MIITNKKEQTRFFKFAFVGAIGAVIDFGVFNLLTQTTEILPVVASIFSFIAAVISNFIWNRFWTYPDSRGKKITQQVIQFLLVSLIGLIIRASLFSPLELFIIDIVNNVLPTNFVLSPIVVGHNITLAVLIVLVMFWNFFANRFWTYNDVES